MLTITITYVSEPGTTPEVPETFARFVDEDYWPDIGEHINECMYHLIEQHPDMVPFGIAATLS